MPGNSSSDVLNTVANPLEASLPQWNESVSSIEKNTASLLEMNARLSSEYQALSQEYIALKSEIIARKLKIKEGALALEARQHELDAPVEMSVGKAKAAKLESAIAIKKESLGTLEAARQRADSKLKLRRLKADSVDLEYKTALAEQKEKTNAALGDVNVEIDSLHDKINSAVEQEKIIRKKLAGFDTAKKPQLDAVRQLSIEKASLKARINAAIAEEQEMTDQLSALAEKRSALEKSPLVSQYFTLVNEKTQLEASNTGIKDELKRKEALAATLPDTIDVVKTKADGVEKQNKQIEDENSNLRENVALLEYKINSLLRYQNRNSKR
ncbi:MAG: hypothetical protein HQL16_05605 [Candidatus Omnitrophica bacterium]|nr:hypothetical protein [Candidatus Omnitrophota bacterium]